jgi:hypothetical protein
VARPLEEQFGMGESSTPKWYKEMESHYAKTGSYRREDVQKVFGNPMGKTEVKPVRSPEGTNFS